MHLQWILSVGAGNGYGSGHNTSVGSHNGNTQGWGHEDRRRAEVSQGQGG